MANGHGGYRRPSHPAPVSGPGSLSKRTDGRQPVRDIPDAAYGEQTAYHDAQSAAPMAAAPSPMPTPVGGGAPSLTPLDAPTARPDEPVTAGAAAGPGVGPEAIGLGQTTPDSSGDIARLKTYLPALIEMANRPEAAQSFRNYVSVLRAQIAAGG